MHSLSWTVKIQLLSCVSNAWTSKKLFLFFFSFEILLLSSCVSFCLFVCLFFLPSLFLSLFLLKSWCCRVVYRLRPSFFPWEAAAASPFRRGETPNNELVANNQKAKWENKIFTRLEFWSQALPKPVTALVFSNGHLAIETSSDIYWSTAFGHDILVDKDRYSGHNGWNVICRFLHILHSSQLDLGAMFSGKEFGPRSCFDL